jgi:predicted amino acid racemase
MFLDLLRRRNAALIEQSIALHQAGKLPANTYVVDLDAVEENSRQICHAADKHGLKVYAMTKQIGRNAACCEAIARGGISKAVAVDMECARATHRAGLGLGHLGHLVQVPHSEAEVAASLSPDFWTVFSIEKAKEAGAASVRNERIQPLLARIVGEGDKFYRGHEGGLPATDINAVASALDDVQGARFAGITTFPSQLFDYASRKVKPTPNLNTLRRAREALLRAGRAGIEINMPGTTSSTILPMLAESGATQVEPGHGLTGTTPLHLYEDLPEIPAMLYLSEVSHLFGGQAYCFGGGLYVDPVFPDYQVRAIVSREPSVAQQCLAPVEIPAPTSIDYYGMIDATAGVKPRVGDSVIFGFRAQAFVTRAFVAGIEGVSKGKAVVRALSDASGRQANWPL